MDELSDLVDAGVTLSAVVAQDDGLYRVAQGLMALAHAPGQRTLLLRPSENRWGVVGQRGGLTEYPPPALGLDAGLRHQAHLYAIFLAPLAVEPTQAQAVDERTYRVERPIPPALDHATRALATALDAQEEAGRGVWLGRAARRERAEAQTRLALLSLRRAAEQVTVRRPTALQN